MYRDFTVEIEYLHPLQVSSIMHFSRQEMEKRQPWLRIVAILFFCAAFVFTVFIDAPNEFMEKIRWLGSAICHQLPSHSFHLNDQQFPLCSRCTGTYLSALLGLVFFITRGRRTGIPKKAILILFLFFFLVWAIDGSNSFFYEVLQQQLLYKPSNIIRFLSGIGMGMVFSLIIMTIVNIVLWEKSESVALLKDWKEVGFLFLCESVLILFPYNKSAFLFNLAGIASVTTALVLIGLLYTILLVILTHQEGTFLTMRGALPVLCLGFGIALFQFSFMANLRMRTLFSIFPYMINK
jgi:uncharacterized membrane protein